MRVASAIVCGVGLFVLGACGGGGSQPVSGAGGAAGAGAGSSECTEHPLFDARAYGDDGADLIRAIVRDDATGDLLFSDFPDLYRVPAGEGEPELFGARPNEDIAGDFWLTDDALLFPGGFQVPLVETATAVLSRTDRNAQHPEIVVPLPTPESLEYRYEASNVRVVGDDVYWIGSDAHTNDPSDLSPKWQTTYALRRTSWRAPGEPVTLYSSEHELKGLVLAGSKAFFDQEVTPGSFEYEQQVVDLQMTRPAAEPAQGIYEGTVLAGDETSLFVARFDYEKAGGSGLFRVAPDGSESELLSTNSFIHELAHDDGTWLFVDPGVGDSMTVWSYRVGAPAKQVGCIAKGGTTVHALALSKDTAWVAIYRDAQATVLSFEL